MEVPTCNSYKRWKAIGTVSDTEYATETPTLPKEETVVTERQSIKKSDVIVRDEIKTFELNDDSVTAKAKQSGRALKDLAMLLAHKTKDTAVLKTEELKAAAEDERPLMERDAADIQRLGGLIDKITDSFDKTVDKIRTSSYEEQAKLFVGYKKMLLEEINVVNARLEMARRMPTDSELRAQDESARVSHAA